MKKIIKTLIILLFLITTTSVYAKNDESKLVSKVMKLMEDEKYTEAIYASTKIAVMNSDSEAAKKLVILAYAMRADAYANEREFGKAANDYRTVLFYTLYFHPEVNTEFLNSKILSMYKHLQSCEKELHFKNTAKNNFYTAKLLELADEYPAAAYEYMQASKCKKYKEESLNKVEKIISIIEGK